MSVRVNETICTGCGGCLLSCPEDAVGIRPVFLAVIDEDLCTDCLVCLDYCHCGAVLEK